MTGPHGRKSLSVWPLPRKVFPCRRRGPFPIDLFITRYMPIHGVYFIIPNKSKGPHFPASPSNIRYLVIWNQFKFFLLIQQQDMLLLQILQHLFLLFGQPVPSPYIFPPPYHLEVIRSSCMCRKLFEIGMHGNGTIPRGRPAGNILKHVGLGANSIFIGNPIPQPPKIYPCEVVPHSWGFISREFPDGLIGGNSLLSFNPEECISVETGSNARAHRAHQPLSSGYRQSPDHHEGRRTGYPDRDARRLCFRQRRRKSIRIQHPS